MDRDPLAAAEPAPTAPPAAPEPTPTPFPAPAGRPTWLDLVLYLGVGFGVFLGLGALLRPVLDQRSIASSALIYSLNVTIFIGTVLVVGVLRHKLSLRTIGFLPPRWHWSWLAVAAGVVVLFLPLRVILALIVELIVHGNLNALANSTRIQIFAPSGFTWASFLVTLVLAGMAAPVAEELFFRGAIYTWFRERTGLWVAALASSTLFAIGHADTLAVVVTSFVLGMVNAWIFEKSRSLWTSIAIHAINNSLAVVLVYAALAANPALK